MKSLHEHIEQYEKDLDAWYAGEKTYIRKILNAKRHTEPIPTFPVGPASQRERPRRDRG